MTAPARLGPNDLMPCGTDTARRRHLALAELCSTCEPLLERPGVCPACGGRVRVVGDQYETHRERILARYGSVEGVTRCPGSGAPARPISALTARMREERIRQGLTQLQLARRAGLAQPTVAGFEAGTSQLRSPNLLAIAQVLRVPLTAVQDGAA